jgi:AIR synthase-related protein
VRIHPHEPGSATSWWRGSRLVVDPAASALRAGVGSRLVRAAMALADDVGALRFDATVQLDKRGFFERLGWRSLGPVTAAGWPHELMLAPADRFERLLSEHKRPLGRLLDGLAPGGAGFVGDDGAPVPGTGTVAACDAILPAMVERDPEWAGWCGVLVNVNDLAAMGAEPLGVLDSVAGRDERHVRRILSGVRAAAEAWGVPVLGGHTQLGGHSALTVTALGATTRPVPGGGGRPGDDVRLLADLGGGWRPGYGGRQWDSSSHRSPDELRRLTTVLRRHRPAAAKDVSMAGMVGTLAMLAEASGTGAELDVAAVPAPDGAGLADWLTCFPGFALVTADRPGARDPDASPATVATVGRLTTRPGVRLRWPDGRTTTAVAGPATGLGPSGPRERP